MRKSAFESVNTEQEIPTGEMLRACVEVTRALLGQSTQAPFVIITDSVVTSRGFPVRQNGNPNMAALPTDWRRYYGNKLAELTRNAMD